MALPLSPYLSTIRAVKIRYRGIAVRGCPSSIFWPHIFPPTTLRKGFPSESLREGGGIVERGRPHPFL